MGSKKRRSVAKSGPLVIDARTVWQAKKPRFNGYACGHGKHGDVKYNRAKAKQAWRRQEDLRGPGKGLLPFMGPVNPVYTVFARLFCCHVRGLRRQTPSRALSCTDVFILDGRATVYGRAQDFRRACSAY